MVWKKAALIVACGAVAAPGVAEATHHTGKLGAPGQVCKPLKQEQKAQLKDFKSTDPAPSKEAIRTFRKMQHAAYKGCIQEAAKARSEDKGQQEQAQTEAKGNSKGAPGQVCKPLKREQKEQLEAFLAQDPKPSKELVREFRRTQRAAYKGCILAAAKARSESKHENKGKGKGHQKQG